MDTYYIISDTELKILSPDENTFESNKVVLQNAKRVLPVIAYAGLVPVTVTELAESLGYITFDCAIPAGFVKHVQEQTGLNPVGNIVWSYDSNRYGEPVPITVLGDFILKVIKHIDQNK